MIKVIIPVFLGGFLLGRFFRNRRRFLSRLDFLISLVVYLLLFSLGVSIGSKQDLWVQIPTLGLNAVYLTLGALGGSILLAYILQRLGNEKKTVQNQDVQNQDPLMEACSVWKNLKGSLGILLSFSLGLLFALSSFLPPVLQENDLSVYILFLLMGMVGMQMGASQGLVKKLKNLPKIYLFLPLATIIGSLLGVSIVSLFIPDHSLSHCLAVGSGLAYYSLSSVLISESISPEWGGVALMSNLLRELAALTLAPLIVKISPLSLISTGGATTMDTTLPINTHYCGPQYTALSAFHGFTTDLSVPFLVTFFCLW